MMQSILATVFIHARGRKRWKSLQWATVHKKLEITEIVPVICIPYFLIMAGKVCKPLTVFASTVMLREKVFRDSINMIFVKLT